MSSLPTEFLQMSSDDLYQAADCLEEYGEYTRMSLIGYSVEEIKEMAEIRKKEEESGKWKSRKC